MPYLSQKKLETAQLLVVEQYNSEPHEDNGAPSRSHFAASATDVHTWHS